MILTVTPNPSVDHTLFVQHFQPGVTNRAVTVERDAGGKGINISRVLCALNTPTLATGLLGGGTGAYVRHVLDAEGVGYDFVKTHGETRTNFEIEDDTGNPPTCLNEPGPMMAPSEIDALVRMVYRHVTDAQWMLLAGSVPPGAPQDLFRRLGSIAKQLQIPFGVDADGEVLRLAITAGPSLLKPNNEEAERLLNVPCETDAEVVAAVRQLRQRMLEGGAPPNAIAIISRGAAGAVMATPEAIWTGTSPQVEVHSTVGSGDSMVAAFLSALCRQLKPEEALRQGLAAGAATAELKGSGLAKLSDVIRLMPKARVDRLA